MTDTESSEIAVLRGHVWRLIEQHHITLYPRTRANYAHAFLDEETHTGWVTLPEVRSQITYVTALHEIAHIVTWHQAKQRLKIEDEGIAWQWVIDHTCCVLGRATWKRIKAWLDTYLTYRQDKLRRHNMLKMPPRSSPFWMTYRIICEGAGCDEGAGVNVSRIIADWIEGAKQYSGRCDQCGRRVSVLDLKTYRNGKRRCVPCRTPRGPGRNILLM